jgi:RNA-directed DNA polymerase
MVLKGYGKVCANKGGAYEDGLVWAVLNANLQGYPYVLWNRMNSGSFLPAPVLQVEIPKESRGLSLLDKPRLLDRIAGQVVRDHLEKQFEPIFHESLFGYRPGRSIHDAGMRPGCNQLNHRLLKWGKWIRRFWRHMFGQTYTSAMIFMKYITCRRMTSFAIASIPIHG